MGSWGHWEECGQQVREVILTLCSALGGHVCVQFWSPSSRKTGVTGENPIEAIKIKGLEHPSDEERLLELGLVSLEKRRLRGDLINVYKYIQEMSEDGVRCFLVVPSNRTKSNGHKLKTQEVPPQDKTKLNSLEDGRALEQEPRELWSPTLWKHPKHTRMSSCVTCSR